MSHFTVLVIGENFEEQLQPYHEFECTGDDDKFVQDIDKTEEYRSDYESHMVNRLKDAARNLYEPYDDRFYREPTPEEIEKHRPMGTGCGGGISWSSRDWGDGKGYRPKVHFVPDGFEEVQVPSKEVMSFLEFVEYQTSEDKTVFGSENIDVKDKHKYGYTLVENGEVVRVIDRTNPNAKWDWYLVGGRWTGFFKMKPGKSGEIGRPGLMTERAKPGYADSALKGDIDFEGMVREHAEEQLGYYKKFHEVVASRPIPNWEEVRTRHGEGKIDDARTEYNGNEVVVDLHKAGFHWDIERYQVEESLFVDRAKRSALSTFAVVKDGQWYEKGSMGWWGYVSDEKEPDVWLEQFYALIQDLPDDTLLTVVYCHI